jgi:hypothetical protein
VAGILGVNQDIQSELSSSSSGTTDTAMHDQRDDQIKKGLTYRDAAYYIMNSLNEVSKKLGMNPLMEPVLENATKAV